MPKVCWNIENTGVNRRMRMPAVPQIGSSISVGVLGPDHVILKVKDLIWTFQEGEWIAIIVFDENDIKQEDLDRIKWV